MNRTRRLVAGGLLALLPALALAQDKEPNVQTPANAYFFREVVQNMMTTQPDRLIKENGSFVNTRQRDTMAKKDDVFFDKGVAQMFAFKNLGKMKVEWSGRTDKKAKFMLAYWDGTQFSPKEVSVNDAVRSHTLLVNRPPTEEFIYILVYCPTNPILTDAVLAELVSDTNKPGL